MNIRIEENARLGRGFQLQWNHGPISKVYDAEPWDMATAIACAGVLVEQVNKEFGTAYKLHEVVTVAGDALEANAGSDFTAARLARDIRTGSYTLSTPATADCKREIIDGEEQYILSGRGVVLLSYFAWLDEKLPKAREALTRYCQYIGMHGFKGGATKALAELDALDKDGAMQWIRRTYARHVHDDRAFMEYIMQR
ncbi:MAG: hypothetical protein E7211_21175 [Clostridium lundense]|nr:hypothetical protein [Clostridium lundense]